MDNEIKKIVKDAYIGKKNIYNEIEKYILNSKNYDIEDIEFIYNYSVKVDLVKIKKDLYKIQ
jgi:hypothetical protein